MDPSTISTLSLVVAIFVFAFNVLTNRSKASADQLEKTQHNFAEQLDRVKKENAEEIAKLRAQVTEMTFKLSFSETRRVQLETENFQLLRDRYKQSP